MTEQSNGSAQGWIKIMGIANLGADPEMRYTPDGKAVTNFRCAINLPVYDQAAGQMVVAPMWMRITCWGKTAEAVNRFLKKGSKVFFESDRPNFDPATGGPRTYVRDDGSPGASYEFTSFTIKFLDRAGDSVTGEGEVVQEESIFP